MTWHYDLQAAIFDCLQDAYRNRRITYNPAGAPVTLIINGGQEMKESYRIKVPKSEGIAGLSVTGLSGCGKSKAVALALSHIPQAILHFGGTPKAFIQIPYLYIVCQPNSNMSAIWDGLAEAVDEAIGNDTIPYYYTQMKKLHKLDQKQDYAARLCRFFNVGLILLDEIEFINPNVRTETLESLVSFNDRTGCALAVIGTETDKNKLFPAWQMCRRFGVDIDAAEYCNNFDEYKQIFDELSEFRWFSPKVVFDDEMKQVMYDESKGTIGSTITIYKEINKHYLKLKEKGKVPEINASFILECAKRCSAKSHERVMTDNNPYNIKLPYEQKIAMLANNTNNNSISKESVAASAKVKSKSNDESLDSTAQRVTKITDMLKQNFDFNVDFISAKVADIILKNPDASDDKIKADAMEQLLKTKKPAKASPKKKKYYDINLAYEEIMKHVVR